MVAPPPRIALFASIAVGLALCTTGGARGQGEPDPVDPAFADFARTIERTLNAHDGKFFDDHYDLALVIDRAYRQLDTSDATRDRIVKQLGRNFLHRGHGDELVRLLGKSGTVRLLKLTPGKNDTHAVFRFLGERGASYEELVLVTGDDGGLKIVDTFPYLVGQWTVEKIHIQLLELLKTSADFNGVDKDYIDAAAAVKVLSDAVLAKRSADGLAAFKRLPATVLSRRDVLIARLSCARQANDLVELQAAVDAIEKAFPRDPGMAFLLIDDHALLGHLAPALAAVDRVEGGVGGDPYLHVRRARLLLSAKRNAEAKAAALKATELEPTLEAAWWQLVEQGLDERDFPAVARDLAVIEDTLGVELADLTASPLFAGFVASKEYGDWFQRRKATAKAAIAKDPREPRYYWRLVTLSLHERQFADTVTWLDQIETKLKIPLKDLTKIGPYAEFVKSDEYRKWMERRRPR